MNKNKNYVSVEKEIPYTGTLCWSILLYFILFSLFVSAQIQERDGFQTLTSHKIFYDLLKIIQLNHVLSGNMFMNSVPYTSEKQDSLWSFIIKKPSYYSFSPLIFKVNYDNSSFTTVKIATSYSLSVWLVSLTNCLTSWYMLVQFKSGWETIRGFYLTSANNLVRKYVLIQRISQQKQHGHSQYVWVRETRNSVALALSLVLELWRQCSLQEDKLSMSSPFRRFIFIWAKVKCPNNCK